MRTTKEDQREIQKILNRIVLTFLVQKNTDSLLKDSVRKDLMRCESVEQATDEFFEGYEAYFSGEKCSYPDESSERYDWQLGFNFASGSPSPYSDEARAMGIYNIGDDD